MKKKSIRQKIKDKFINWIFEGLIYDSEIKITREEIYNLKKFRDEQNKDTEQLYKNINELDMRFDLFFQSVYRFLPKIYEVYHKNRELQEFRSKYLFNSDVKEFRKFTEEKFEEEIKEILKR